MLSDGRTHHYTLITNLQALVQKVRNKVNRWANDLCRNCFHVFSTLERLEKHRKICMEFESTIINMPTEKESQIKFSKLEALAYAPLVGYFDFESIIEPFDRCMQNPNVSSSCFIEYHKPCSYAIAIVEHGCPKPVFFKLERGENALDNFVALLDQLAKDVYHRKRQHVLFSGIPTISKDMVTSCCICGICFNTGDMKVLDHCHYSGKFLGWAHQKCNIQRRTNNYMPIFAHNLSNYDMHHIIRSLNKTNLKNKLTVIPSTDEKYICLSIGVWIKAAYDKKGKLQNVYEYIRILDSCKFMTSSLESLVANLSPNKFQLLETHFENHCLEDINLLKQKGFYPYSYVSNFSKFQEVSLPLKEKWINSLTGFEVSVDEEQYQHALKVFKTFKCKNIGEYHDLYLTSDTLLLACVYEEFREVSFKTYKLDCTNYYTASNLSWDALLRICKADIQLLTDREHLDVVEGLMRGGLSSVFAKRLCKANNKYLPDWDSSKPSTYLAFIDANNLYGGIMAHYPLPLKDFCFSDVTIEEVLATPDTSSIGYILEVDITYPEELHDIHADFPLAPTKEKIPRSWLSAYQNNMLDHMGVKGMGKTRKLVQTLFAKQNYTVHYITLKLYVELGMKVEKIHRVLQFHQEKWLKPYVDLNTEKRKLAVNKFEENFYKLMVNSAYGKTCEGKRNRSNVHLVRGTEELLRLTAKPGMKSFKIIDSNLASVTCNPTSTKWNKPTIVGAVILDLAKQFMFSFHYKVMKKNFKCSVLYSDTDSFVYEINTEDLYKDLENNSTLRNAFDFSNMPKDNPLYDETNAKVVLKFKDEFAGTIVEEFCGLNPKLYSIIASCEYLILS